MRLDTAPEIERDTRVAVGPASRHASNQICHEQQRQERCSANHGQLETQERWLLTMLKALPRQLITIRCIQLDLLAIGAYEGVLLRVEGQVPSNGEGSDQLRGCDKGMGGGVAIVSCSKVTVV